jgi:hypothetical protein
MSKKRMPYARIAITIPKADLETADRLAKQQDRPRSWLIAEAIRRYAAAGADGRDGTGGRTTFVSGIGPSRRAQLLADLALSPEQRVRAAEDSARVSFLLRPPIGRRVLAFDRYEDYLEWKRREQRGE